MKLVRVMTCVALALIGLTAALILFGHSAVWAQQVFHLPPERW